LFEREHHRRIALVLQALDPQVLAALGCHFGGGTAMALRYGEYRESVDIDFLVSDLAGYRELRQRPTPVDLAAEKLLANADRWADDAVFSRDLIDLAMQNGQSDPLRAACAKAEGAYGAVIRRALVAAWRPVQRRNGTRQANGTASRVTCSVTWSMSKRSCRRVAASR
jgi:hypothetical protein